MNIDTKIKLLDALDRAGTEWAAGLRLGQVFTGCLPAARKFLDDRLGPAAATQRDTRDRLASFFVQSALRALDARKVEVILDAGTGVILELRQIR